MPTKAQLHGMALNSGPIYWLSVKLQGTVQSRGKSTGTELVEDKPTGSAIGQRLRCTVTYSISQPTDTVHNWQRTIPNPIELRQPTGFET